MANQRRRRTTRAGIRPESLIVSFQAFEPPRVPPISLSKAFRRIVRSYRDCCDHQRSGLGRITSEGS